MQIQTKVLIEIGKRMKYKFFFQERLAKPALAVTLLVFFAACSPQVARVLDPGIR
jgi:hypothetical protein